MAKLNDSFANYLSEIHNKEAPITSNALVLSSSSNDLLLSEIREIKEQVKTATALTTLKDSERKFWKELVDSNIRAGTIACLWCLKAQAIKRISGAFNKWKLFTAIKNQEINQVESNVQHKSEISSVIDNALSIIHKYKEEGIMNRINSSSWKSSQTAAESDLVFPWEERRNPAPQQQPPQPHSEAPLSINPSTLQYINKTLSGDLFQSTAGGSGVDHHSTLGSTMNHTGYSTTSQSSIPPPPPPLALSQPPSPTRLHETMETTNKVWNFIQKQFQRKSNNEILDPETERQLLLALSYDIIQRGEQKMNQPSEEVKDFYESNHRAPSPPKHATLSPKLSKQQSSSLRLQSRFPENTLDIPNSGPSSPYVAYDEIYPEFPGHSGHGNGAKPVAAVTKDHKSNNGIKPVVVGTTPAKSSSFGASPRSSNKPIVKEYQPVLRNSYDDNQVKTPSQQRMSSHRNTTPGSASRKRSSSAPSNSSRKSYAEKTLVDVLKFRRTREGDYVKDLLSPSVPATLNEGSAFQNTSTEPVEPVPVRKVSKEPRKQQVVDDYRQPARNDASMYQQQQQQDDYEHYRPEEYNHRHSRPDISNASSSSARPRASSRTRSVGQSEVPRYLAPTNSYRKKVVSPEAARQIRESKDSRRQPGPPPPQGRSREYSYDAPSDSHYPPQQQQQHQHQYPEYQEYPDEFHDHHPVYRSHSDANVQSRPAQVPQQAPVQQQPPQQHYPPQQQYQQLPQQQPPVEEFQQAQPPLGAPTIANSPSRLTKSQDLEYEYYEQLLKEQQQQFYNYQTQSASRVNNSHVDRISSLKNLIESNNAMNYDLQQTGQSFESQNDPNSPPLQQYQQQQQQQQPPRQSSRPDRNNGHPSHYHPDPYAQYNDSMMNNEDQEVYSLNPSYYSGNNNRVNYVNSSRQSSEAPPSSRNRNAAKPAVSNKKANIPSPPRKEKKMEKAQQMLLYGVLHDVMDAKKAWERNLRR